MSSIVITGATAGIGRAAAILLASKKHRVFAAGRDPTALAELDAGYENITALEMDVTDSESVRAAVAKVFDALDGQAPDVLVNNAGYAVVGPLEAISDDDWEQQFRTNVLGLVRVTKAFVPGMRERRRGRVINVSSVAGKVTVPFFGPYNSTKHAVESISDSLRHELRPHGVDVVVIEPGAVKTRFGSLEQQQIEHWIENAPAYAEQLRTLKAFHHDLHSKGADPITVAGSIVDACEGHRPSPRRVVPFFPGSAFIAINAWLPTRVSDWIVQKLTGLP
ncbi:MAG: NADP-dependent 3-hydroxy acid dehydrogenase YdfG [Glaciecola sp.]|jgi:NADP-dependent 3-hydroxy acid dehydrogenase YdfG|uniref:SDR family oxidoreductase n=1 Tax=Congregibacter sp. TaxID=2744308 RepID=UPI0039E48CA8